MSEIDAEISTALTEPEVPEPPQSYIKTKVDRLHKGFISTLGEESELHTALARSGNPKAQQFLRDILHPRYARWSIVRLAEKNEVTAQQLLDIWRDHHLSKAMLALVGGIPQIASDMVADARSTQVECPKCDGFGIIQKEGIPQHDCPRCKGTGAVRKPGDSDSRKLILETLGWTGKRAALIQQNFYQAGVESVIDELETIEVTPISDTKAG